MKGFATAAMLLASASSALAGSLKIHNWNSSPIYFWIDNNGGASTVIAAGSTYNHAWIGGGASTSLKITNVNNIDQEGSNVLQFEYTLDPGTLWYDMSNINGRPFAAQNVKISPTGKGSNSGSCAQLKCAANAACASNMAYTVPSDNLATHSCPADTGDMWLDIGEPTAQFNSRSLQFSA